MRKGSKRIKEHWERAERVREDREKKKKTIRKWK